MKNKIVCYTCITGDYDTLRDPLIVCNNVDYVCFTDNQNLKSNIWLIRQIPDELQGLSKVKQQRVIKICPHRYCQDYDISIWIDGNIIIKGDLNKFISEYDLNKIPFYTRIHPGRNCIYSEAEAVLQFGKEKYQVVNKIVERYKIEGFPQRIGLAETCIILRKHNDSKCILLDNMWASELLCNSYRDQLSFNYVCWKLHFQPGYMINQFKINKNKYFEFKMHG